MDPGLRDQENGGKGVANDFGVRFGPVGVAHIRGMASAKKNSGKGVAHKRRHPPPSCHDMGGAGRSPFHDANSASTEGGARLPGEAKGFDGGRPTWRREGGIPLPLRPNR